MLTAGDLALVRRDQAIPGLSVVLDPDAVLALAARSGGAAAVAARPTYARYKPATSCVVGYELTTTEGPVFLYAKAHAPAAAAKLAKARIKDVRDERWGVGVTLIDEQLVMLAAAASDRDLPAMQVFADCGRSERLMRRLLPDHPDLWRRQPRTIRHKPERRWVGLAKRDDGQPIALIKAYRNADVRRARTLQRHLAAPPGRPLGWSERHAALASRWVPGTTLAEMLRTDPAARTSGVGAALAALHATTPTRDVGHDGGRRVDSALGPAAGAIANVLPHFETRVRRLAAELRSIVTSGDADQCVVHGDFSAEQVVVSAAGVHLIDFDQAHIADPAADLASFGAGLIRAGLEGRLHPDRIAALLDGLVAEYEHAGGPPVRDRLAEHLAGALLRMAIAPFRERHTEWPMTCAALVEEAERSASSLPVGGLRWR